MTTITTKSGCVLHIYTNPVDMDGGTPDWDDETPSALFAAKIVESGNDEFCDYLADLLIEEQDRQGVEMLCPNDHEVVCSRALSHHTARVALAKDERGDEYDTVVVNPFKSNVEVADEDQRVQVIHGLQSGVVFNPDRRIPINAEYVNKRALTIYGFIAIFAIAGSYIAFKPKSPDKVIVLSKERMAEVYRNMEAPPQKVQRRSVFDGDVAPAKMNKSAPIPQYKMSK